MEEDCRAIFIALVSVNGFVIIELKTSVKACEIVFANMAVCSKKSK